MLDNSILSETSKPRPDPAVIKFLRTEEYVIPAGTLMEIQLGIAAILSTDPRKAQRLEQWYEDIVASGVPIAETDAGVARVWGRLANDSRLKNLRVQQANERRARGLQDLHIAAAAISRNAVVATMDVDDFMLIHRCYPLPGLFNPSTGVWHAGDPIRSYLRASRDERCIVRRSLADFLADATADEGSTDPRETAGTARRLIS